VKHKHLGRTGLIVSQFCLGTMNFGPFTTEPDAYTIMDKALDVGVNFFDTANVYGRKRGEGVTEQIIGRWLAQGGGRREKVVLATKVYSPMGEGPNERRLSAYHIRRACDESLRRLQTDHIDLYQFHHVDRDTPWEEVWQALEQLVQAGKILYVGSSNFAGWQIAQACEAAKARHFMGLVCEQSLYNLGARTIELEVVPACRAYGLGIVAWSPLSGGALAGGVAGTTTGRRAEDLRQQFYAKNKDKMDQYVALCKEMGEKPADVALAWVLHNPVVTGPIIGPRTTAQLEANLHALEITLSPEVLAKLDAIWPGPGGEAPEAYAW
jgi:aryl-alcohol dehydrogenase-like predicted oxidoreductase